MKSKNYKRKKEPYWAPRTILRKAYQSPKHSTRELLLHVVQIESTEQLQKYILEAWLASGI